jgi:hypothetical protein
VDEDERSKERVNMDGWNDRVDFDNIVIIYKKDSLHSSVEIILL